MHRRDFLKLSAAAGLVALSPLGGERRAKAADAPAPYGGPFIVTVHASGGWDPTALCDPKGRASEAEDKPVNRYPSADIRQAGAIRYAPIDGLDAFFEAHHGRLCVVNGVDTSTNSHDAGARNTWCGVLTEGHPSFAAVAAAALGRDRPMAYLTNGGYDVARGEVAVTRMGDTGVFARIAHPDRVDPADAGRTFHLPSTQARIQAAQRERLAAATERANLPRTRQAMNALASARSADNELARLTDALPAALDASNNPLKRQAQLAVAAFKSGLSVAANLALGGFDTHGNHDQNHYPRLVALVEGVSLLWEEAERAGIAGELVVLVGSDFGRTPYYNDGAGKDHWSVTSMMLMGRGIPGDRVIGATDAGHRPLTVNAQTLAVDPAGIRIEPAHIHRALRRLLGIEGSAVANRWYVPGADLPLFG